MWEPGILYAAIWLTYGYILIILNLNLECTFSKTSIGSRFGAMWWVPLLYLFHQALQIILTCLGFNINLRNQRLHVILHADFTRVSYNIEQLFFFSYALGASSIFYTIFHLVRELRHRYTVHELLPSHVLLWYITMLT